MLALRQPLPHVARRLAEGRSLTVVALGSSSTLGTGASSPANAYPARLESELHALLPHMAVTVINKGVGGEDAGQMLARFERDVLAAEPDLLIWQAGVNAAIRGTSLAEFVEQMSEGIERARARHRRDADGPAKRAALRRGPAAARIRRAHDAAFPPARRADLPALPHHVALDGDGRVPSGGSRRAGRAAHDRRELLLPRPAARAHDRVGQSARASRALRLTLRRNRVRPRRSPGATGRRARNPSPAPTAPARS
ncbi:MAG: SGNH/GDSL hydrolase family protein [Tagaea sp.]